MGGQQRIYKQRIRSTQTLAKVFRAMELIAASRIAKARDRPHQANPYDAALIESVGALSTHCNFDHPLTMFQGQILIGVAVLVVTSDRGMAGAYSANILRESEAIIKRLREDGKEPVLFVSGRRAQSYFKFRGVKLDKTWEGESDNPGFTLSNDVANTLLDYFLNPDPEKGVCELFILFSQGSKQWSLKLLKCVKCYL